MLCPVCNGLESLSTVCASCGNTAADCGPLSDYAGPYAPYEPDYGMVNGSHGTIVSHEGDQNCKHIVCCTQCGQSQEVAVMKWLANGG
ncbi:hypothetical protein FHS18_000442 [Paenibacillus phyllosphaerae]|uniref:Uncharacterized protein n=1 Tax=Paenibacillus phyllosphaerae TaxID=274593 RepID=A0A7W5ATS1_9BACL|nr:hypothetical protein [Paenibacillus phyllosphaerae]